MYKSDSQYEIDDIILSEYGTTVVGLEMMRSVHEENAEENRKIQIVKSAINTLSFSELEAIIHIFDELDGMEGIRLPARSQTAWASPVPLSSTPFENSRVPASSSPAPAE